MKVAETIALLGENVCLEAYCEYEASGNGANTICQGFEARIIDAIADSGYPLRDGGLSHGGLTRFGDAMIDAGRWLVTTDKWHCE